MDDCTCEFDPEWDEDGDPSYHFTRACRVCGQRWGALHCEHDGVQNPSPCCGWIDPGTRTPLQMLYPGILGREG